jgi:guanine deaminase
MPTVEGVNALAQAYADAGMRAVIAPMMADRTFYKAIPGLIDAMPEAFRARLASMNATPYEASLAVCGQIVAGWKHDRDRIRPALAPTIPHHCTDAFLIGARDMARDLGLGLHTHVGESKVQAVVSGSWYEGHTLVAHLAKLGYLGPNFTAAHAVWLDDDDMKRVADNGVSVAHNPGSNLILGSGIAAVRRMREHGINVGIGTDGTTSSDNLNMFEAMRLASMVSRMQSLDTARWLSAAESFTAATVGSAKALGMERLIGQIAPGFKADLVLLDLANMNWLPLNDVVGQLIRGEDGTAVDTVMVGGTVVYADHRYTHLDPLNLARQVEAAVQTLRQTTAEVRAFAAALEPHVNHYCAGLAAKSYPIDRLGLHHEGRR